MSDVNLTPEREMRSGGRLWELIDGTWYPACEIDCSWGHKHRTAEAARRCRESCEAQAVSNGWTPPASISKALGEPSTTSNEPKGE